MQNSASVPLADAPQGDAAPIASSPATWDVPEESWYVDLRTGRIVRRRATAIDAPN
jgi:hypothetical protein